MTPGGQRRRRADVLLWLDRRWSLADVKDPSSTTAAAMLF
jgi:hypothetical protein